MAGSVGPYGAGLHDGSEYHGDYVETTSSETILTWHKPRLEALLDAGVDLLAIETIPALAEAELLVNLIKQYPKAKAWLAFSCKVNRWRFTRFRCQNIQIIICAVMSKY